MEQLRRRRLVGAHGEREVAWVESNPSVGGGGVAIVRPTREWVDLPIDSGPMVWLPGGSSLLVLETLGDLAAARSIVTWDGSAVRRTPIQGGGSIRSMAWSGGRASSPWTGPTATGSGGSPVTARPA